MKEQPHKNEIMRWANSKAGTKVWVKNGSSPWYRANPLSCEVCHRNEDDELICHPCKWLASDENLTYCKHPDNNVDTEGNNTIENCPLQHETRT